MDQDIKPPTATPGTRIEPSGATTTPAPAQVQNAQPTEPNTSIEEPETIVITPTVAPVQEPEVAPNPVPVEETDEFIDETSEMPPKGQSGLKSALSTIGIIIAAPLLAIFLTMFVFQSYEVDGDSMETTLQDNDRLIVWKLPASIAKLTSGAYIPGRGEVIIFHKTEGEGAVHLGEKQLIKRVIGLPGERVVIRDNQITIYNQERPDGFDPDKLGLYTITNPFTPGNVDLTVPEGEVFVVGDNRTNSLDSRAIGTVTSEEIVGELHFRIFPFNKAKYYK